MPDEMTAAERARAICNEWVHDNGFGPTSDWHVQRLLPLADQIKRELEQSRERERALVRAIDRLIAASNQRSRPGGLDGLDQAKEAARALAGQTEQAKRCLHGDPTCPCQDGDPCHYEDFEGTGAMPPPEQAEDDS